MLSDPSGSRDLRKQIQNWAVRSSQPKKGCAKMFWEVNASGKTLLTPPIECRFTCRNKELTPNTHILQAQERVPHCLLRWVDSVFPCFFFFFLCRKDLFRRPTTDTTLASPTRSSKYWILCVLVLFLTSLLLCFFKLGVHRAWKLHKTFTMATCMLINNFTFSSFQLRS